MSRELKDLDPIVKLKAEVLRKTCEAAGVKIIFTYTLRTQQEQAALWAQGRQSLETVNQLRKAVNLAPITEKQNAYKVTNTMQSLHLYGVAFDIAVLDKLGRPTWDAAFDGDDDLMADYDEVGKIGMGLGLEWGGSWSEKRRDKPHFQYTAGLTLEQLASGLRPSDVYNQASGVLSHGLPQEG